MAVNRVVVTGTGVVAPNGTGITEFDDALKKGKSGIKYLKELENLDFSCRIGGIPKVNEELIKKYFTPLQLKNFSSSGIIYGCIAGMDAWKDAGLNVNAETPDWDSGLIFGAGSSGVDKMHEAFYKIDERQVRKLGSNALVQTMASGISAYLNGMIGFGNQVTTNSSACSTGTEAILMAYERIKSGKAKRMLAGSTCDHGPYVWGGFDAMKVLTYKSNSTPEKGSRPMSETASGFVPGSGAGALVLEQLESALKRKARIYAEVLGGAVNSGGQRNDGSITAPNSAAIQKCIKEAVENSGIDSNDIDAIDGHLTSTSKDPLEVKNWAEALQRSGSSFPYINSLKSMTGHCLSASGAVESVATVLELAEQFLYPSINCEDVHHEIDSVINKDKIPRQVLYPHKLDIIAKASFGFGDVNACIIFKKFISKQ
jgi:3-oxoacyl-[acyl-carrier-protein] synthase-1